MQDKGPQRWCSAEIVVSAHRLVWQRGHRCQYVRGKGADVPLSGDVQADSGKGSILVHHARYLSREVVGSSLEHLSHVTAPGWRLFWPAEGVIKQLQWGSHNQP